LATAFFTRALFFLGGNFFAGMAKTVQDH